MYSVCFRDIKEQLRSRWSSDVDSSGGQKGFWEKTTTGSLKAWSFLGRKQKTHREMRGTEIPLFCLNFRRAVGVCLFADCHALPDGYEVGGMPKDSTRCVVWIRHTEGSREWRRRRERQKTEEVALFKSITSRDSFIFPGGESFCSHRPGLHHRGSTHRYAGDVGWNMFDWQVYEVSELFFEILKADIKILNVYEKQSQLDPANGIKLTDAWLFNQNQQS